MRQLSRADIRAVVPGPCTAPRSDRLLQESLGGCPWRASIASMLLCRTTRKQAESALQALLRRWPGAEYLCRADVADVESVVRPCGLYRNRARQLVKFSSLYLGDAWSDLRELPGVGAYVADAVGLVCFGDTDLESEDGALRMTVAKLGVIAFDTHDLVAAMIRGH